MLIFTADIHLRDSVPKCRTDDFLKAQWDKIAQVKNLCDKYKATWIDAGDFLHKAYPSLALIAKTLQILHGTKIHTLFGNHDMPYHNQDKAWEAGFGVLYQAGVLKILDTLKIGDFQVYGWPYGQEYEIKPSKNGIRVLVYHGMIYKGRQDVLPEVAGFTAKQFLKKYKDFDLIVCGHNHKQFEVEIDGRVLINVGCLTRQTTEFADHVPRVLLVSSTAGGGFTYDLVPLSVKSGVVNREHLDKQAKKEEELNAFVEGLQDVEEVSLSFQKNVGVVMEKTNPTELTRQKVEEAIYDR